MKNTSRKKQTNRKQTHNKKTKKKQKQYPEPRPQDINDTRTDNHNLQLA